MGAGQYQDHTAAPTVGHRRFLLPGGRLGLLLPRDCDGRGFHEQRYTARLWRRLLQGPVVGIDSQVYHGYIISD